MIFKNLRSGEMVEEDIDFTGTDNNDYVQITRLDEGFVLAVDAKPGNITPAPGIVCLRKVKE